MSDETLYNNVCLAVMANLQGFYREDGDIYLGRIDWKNKKDRFIFIQAIFCSNINKECKVHVAMSPYKFWKLKRYAKRGDLIRESPRDAKTDYYSTKINRMLEFTQNAYGYTYEKDGFSLYEKIYNEFFCYHKEDSKN